MKRERVVKLAEEEVIPTTMLVSMGTIVETKPLTERYEARAEKDGKPFGLNRKARAKCKLSNKA